jgi:hypothetical protein
VSTTSDDVSPRWRNRPSSPTVSATDDTKAITSCFTSASIACIARDVDTARVAETPRRVRRHVAALGEDVDQRELDVEPARETDLLAPEPSHLRTRVPSDHRCSRSRRPREAVRQRRHLLPRDRRYRTDHELGNAVAATNVGGRAAEVHEEDLHLAAVVGVDRARRVQDR